MTKTETTKENPIAKVISELVTPRQLWAIRAIANVGRVDAENVCADFFGQSVKPEELSRRAASRFIDHLKTREQ
jgi:hypothetical protein